MSGGGTWWRCVVVEVCVVMEVCGGGVVVECVVCDGIKTSPTKKYRRYSNSHQCFLDWCLL